MPLGELQPEARQPQLIGEWHDSRCVGRLTKAQRRMVDLGHRSLGEPSSQSFQRQVTKDARRGQWRVPERFDHATAGVRALLRHEMVPGWSSAGLVDEAVACWCCIGRTLVTGDGAGSGCFSRRLDIHISWRRNQIARFHSHTRNNNRCT